MEMESLKELYVDQLKDLWSAENQITKALPKMIKASTNAKLKRAFNSHLKQTERHMKRLERIFKEVDESPRGKKCVGMEGIIREGADLIKEKPDADVLDAGLIAAAQHVEHYEIAGYGSVRTWARQMGEDRQADLLQETLDEEEDTDRLLTDLAESTINLAAEEAEEEAPARTRAKRPGARRGVSKAATPAFAGSEEEEEEEEPEEDSDEESDEEIGVGGGRGRSM
jgi:ferritin-like metal-binding protein YciE